MPIRNRAIKLSSFKKIRSTDIDNFSVKFFASPSLSEQGSSSYAEISDIRQPSSILIWMGSPSRTFTIGGKFIARTVAEADVAFRNVNLIKSWRVTDSTISSGGEFKIFDTETFISERDPLAPNDITRINNQDLNNTASEPTPVENLKSFGTLGDLFDGTPEVLLLEGYGTQFRRIPVVLTSYTIDFSPDVSYIRNSKGADVPIMQDVNLTLKEAREVSKAIGSIASFSLKEFKEGTLRFW